MKEGKKEEKKKENEREKEKKREKIRIISFRINMLSSVSHED